MVVLYPDHVRWTLTWYPTPLLVDISVQRTSLKGSVTSQLDDVDSQVSQLSIWLSNTVRYTVNHLDADDFEKKSGLSGKHVWIHA